MKLQFPLSAVTQKTACVMRTDVMRAAIVGLLLSVTFVIESIPVMADRNHLIPTNRSELKHGEQFPFVLSKIAPLEGGAIKNQALTLSGRTVAAIGATNRLARILGNSCGSVFRCFVPLKSRMVLC